MFKNIANGFMKVMNSVKAAFEESYNGNYAGWNEGEELTRFVTEYNSAKI